MKADNYVRHCEAAEAISWQTGVKKVAEIYFFGSVFASVKAQSTSERTSE